MKYLEIEFETPEEKQLFMSPFVEREGISLTLSPYWNTSDLDCVLYTSKSGVLCLIDRLKFMSVMRIKNPALFPTLNYKEVIREATDMFIVNGGL